jgi:hypothetical protein
VVYFELKGTPPPKERISLSFATDDGKQIAMFSNQTDANGKPIEPDTQFYPPKQRPDVVAAKAGMNRFVWNMRYPDATEVKGAVLWDGSLHGPTVVPGTYRVTLKVGNATDTREFEIREDPRSDSTQADLEAQLSFLQKVQEELDQTDRVILKLRAVRGEVQDYLARIGQTGPDTVALKKAAKSMTEHLDAIEQALIQTKSHADEDPLNYPIRLNNELAALAATAGRSFSRPTRQEYAVFAELSAKLSAQQKAFDIILSEQLPALNRLIAQQHIAPISTP